MCRGLFYALMVGQWMQAFANCIFVLDLPVAGRSMVTL